MDKLLIWLALGAVGCRVEYSDDAAPDGGSLDSGDAAIGPWRSRPSPVTTQLDAVWTRDGELVVAVGVGGVIVRSTDGGATWGTISSGTTAWLHDVYGIGDDVYAVGDGGTVVHSADAGQSFRVVDAGVTSALSAVWAYDEGNVWIGGDDLLRSAD